jgi:hypothetical protein
VLIGTTSFKLRDQLNGAGSTPTFTFKSSTKFALAANRITPPARGSSGDPTLVAGGLLVYNSAGQTNEVFALSLSQNGWRYLGSVSNPKGYKYDGRKAGDLLIKSVTIKQDSLRVKGRIAFTLDEPAQERMTVRLNLGSTFCSEALAKMSGNPPSTARYDHPGLFTAQGKTPAPASCPAVP